MRPKQDVMKTRSGHLHLRAVLAIAAIAVYSTGCGSVPATLIAVIPSASGEAATPTLILPTGTPIATRTPTIATATVESLPTSTWKEGWVDFINGYYGYAISLPPSAEVSKAEIDTIPGWAQSQSFDQLNMTYPLGMCVGINYQSAYVTIRVANWLGG